jgi:hypothetical protein
MILLFCVRSELVFIFVSCQHDDVPVPVDWC